jgi:glycosyltransferase involved in cell wall biosynthesis
MESHASGLPAICDNHSGMKDRVTNETGWLCDKYEDYFEVIKEILSNPGILRTKGNAARERAKQEFIRENWIKEILKDE